MENIRKRIRFLEMMWKQKRAELIYTRDWRAESYLRLEIIDLKTEHKLLLSKLTALTAE